MNVQNHAAIKELTLSTEEIALQPEAGAIAADLKARTDVVAAVAAPYAGNGRPRRAPTARSDSGRANGRLLGIMVPHDLGGEGASLSDAVDVCYGLGRSCASPAMIYAMHQTKVACILRHGRNSAWHEHVSASPECRTAPDGVVDHRKTSRRRRAKTRRRSNT